jgi:RHS repeat-associated protein
MTCLTNRPLKSGTLGNRRADAMDATRTPALSAVDSRGFNVRQVQYCRLPGATQSQLRIQRQHIDGAGQILSEHDPRLGTSPSQTNVYSLSGARLLSRNVDAGWQLRLLGEARQVLQTWDEGASHWQTDFDSQLRPVARHETAHQQPRRTLERLIYGDSSTQSASHNQCGRLIHHYDPGGLLSTSDFALTAAPLKQTRSFALSLTPVDWPAHVLLARNALEPTAYDTAWRYNALGETLLQTDAKGHRQSSVIDVAGQLKALSLQLKHASAAQLIVDNLHYSATGRQLGYTTGNGVVSQFDFDPVDGRLARILAMKDKLVRQHTLYHYDPVGNLTSLTDKLQATHYAANHRADNTRHFTYDSLNQLISATGVEAPGATTHPQLPGLITPIDLSRRSAYTQHYTYDNGGNLTKLVHTSPIPGQGHTRVMAVDPSSNRVLRWSQGDDAVQTFPMTYDASGNLHVLQPGAQPLTWNPRDQLERVVMLHRGDDEDDFEHFNYAADGNRIRKWQSTRAASITHIHKAHYLPGLTLHTEDGREERHVISLQAGLCLVHCLHWPEGAPAGIEQDTLRFCLSDHQQSCLTELDGDGQLLSHEDYYPYGGTACQAARSQVHAHYKTLRYSGKERDSCGLYYYGARYYAPWLLRWISADPTGTADGLNLYCMAHNSPVTKVDSQGLNAEIAYLIAGVSLVAAAVAAAASYFRGATPAPAPAPKPLPSGIDLHPTEQTRLQDFNKQVPHGQPLEVRKLNDGAVWAYVPKNLRHATDLSNASDINLQKQIAKGVFPSIKLRDAPPTAAPAKKTVAPTAYSPFEVAATTKVSGKKASRVAAVEEVVQPIAATASARQRGATIDAEHFFSSRHFLEWDTTQQEKIRGVLEEFSASVSAANYHKYSHDTEQDQNIPYQMGKPRTLREIHTLDVTSFEGTAGGRGDWRLVLYQINGTFYPQRMDRHRDIVARARR